MTHSDRRCQLGKDMAQHTARLEEGDDDCFHSYSWGHNVVIAFGTVSSFLMVSGVVCVVCPFTGERVK